MSFTFYKTINIIFIMYKKYNYKHLSEIIITYCTIFISNLKKLEFQIFLDVLFFKFFVSL